MVSLTGLTNIWGTIKEVDLRPLRDQALNGVRLTLIGAPRSGRTTLAEKLRRDPSHPEIEIDTPIQILDLESAAEAANADLIILLLDSRKMDFPQEKQVAQAWRDANKRVLVIINQFDQPGEAQAIIPWVNWAGRRIIRGPITDDQFLSRAFAPAVIDLLPDKLLALGRYFPIFRVPVATYLINDTSFSNAAYSLSTGLAEIVPILDIPLNLADMVVLTKTQAYLVYKLGLALGFSTHWQDYVTEFGGVLGSGFLWRQLARSLVGLIPVYGIAPKVAVAYSGTYVVGHAVLRWYLTGRHISPQQMRQLTMQAFDRGKQLASSLINRLPHPRLPKPRLPQIHLPKRKARLLPAPKNTRTCPDCEQVNPAEASFCLHCGKPLDVEIKLEE